MMTKEMAEKDMAQQQGEIILYQPDETVRLEAFAVIAKFATTAKDGKASTSAKLAYMGTDGMRQHAFLATRKQTSWRASENVKGILGGL